MLHVSYKLEEMEWRKNVESAERIKARKKAIFLKMRDQLGLIVDVPKTGGSGTSNDGNTARIAFANHEKMAEILEMDHLLIKRIWVILCALSSQEAVDPDRFQVYCRETAERYVAQYAWYPMPASCHKILVHGHQAMREKPVPVGLLSEECQEASNKVVKFTREHFSRKMSRALTNEDVMRRMLANSDPLITSKRKIQAPKHAELPEEAVALLKK
jgi:hypothetical protein